MWEPVSTAPFDRDVEGAFIYSDRTHTLAFPCRRVLGGWINGNTRQPIMVHPTHWQEWKKEPSNASSLAAFRRAR
jgi:hypothetical protein